MNGTHPDDLAANEFQALAFPQDAGFRHSVVIVNRE
jgi:hypothetical protein